jgi:hypothetical protein
MGLDSYQIRKDEQAEKYEEDEEVVEEELDFDL